jgi:hypothetical protein
VLFAAIRIVPDTVLTWVKPETALHEQSERERQPLFMLDFQLGRPPHPLDSDDVVALQN